jgi:aspartate-semialdehyde dehydrogenase
MSSYPISQSQSVAFKPNRPIKVGVLGATGAVGQRFVQLLEGHPWFKVTALGGSDRNIGKKYGQAAQWRLSADVPAYAREITLIEGKPSAEWDCDVIFTSLPADIAGEIEEEYASAGYKVFSNSRNHRMTPDVPLMVPEINPDHSAMLEQQQQRWGSTGFIVTNPNCTTIHLVLALKPLQDAFGLKKVLVTSLQSLSGAGYPGVSALDIIDNVVPYIGGGEEEKVETEPLKIMGGLVDQKFVNADFVVSATCTRVAVREAHTESVSVQLGREASLEEVASVLRDWEAEPQRLGLPSAPVRPVLLRSEPDRPQPFYDRDGEGAMATTVGRLRRCPILDYKFVLVGHNTIRGAAGASILNAELLVAQGWIK